MSKRRNNAEDNFDDTSQPHEGTNESHESGHRDDYFLSDPASWWDILPQPFVMINKTVDYLLERAWSSIEQRQRVKRSQRISRTDSAACNTPTVYGPGGVLSQVSNISNAGYCDDEPYIVFGTASGLYVVDGLSQTVCASWQGPNTEILETHLYSTLQKTFLITSVDDLGDARVFLFIEPDILQLVFTVYEKVENEVKPLVATCAASASGEYLAVSIDSTPNRKGRSIAVYSLPFENWDTQLRANTPTKQEGRQASPVEAVAEETQPTALLTDGKEEKNSQYQKPNLILKIPALEISPGNPSKNLYQICKSVDVSGEVIGTGYNNVISQAHLDLRKAVLEYLHEDLKRYTQEPETPLSPLNFQFIQSTAILFPSDGQNQANGGSAILVWCSDSHILSLYLLGKPRKDGVFLEADRVWPFAASITSLAVSRFSTMLAIGLENGCVVVWDIYFGIMRGVHYLGGPSSVRQLHFIYSERHQDPTQKGDFVCDIIATLRNGVTKRITSSASEPLTVVTILPEAHTDDILVMRLIPIPGKNELVLITFSNGVVVLVDVFEGDSLCELQLSAGYHLSCSWAPVISVVSSNILTNDHKTYAYIIGNSEATPGCCFYFQLNKLPVLKSYWSSLPKSQIFVTPISFEDQQNKFLNERREQQKERNARLSVRWKELSQYIAPPMNDVEKLEVAG